MLRSQIMDLFHFSLIEKLLKLFSKSSTSLGTWSEGVMNNFVNRSVSKDTAFYPKICPAQSLTKRHLFLKTNFFFVL